MSSVRLPAEYFALGATPTYRYSKIPYSKMRIFENGLLHAVLSAIATNYAH